MRVGENAIKADNSVKYVDHGTHPPRVGGENTTKKFEVSQSEPAKVERNGNG